MPRDIYIYISVLKLFSPSKSSLSLYYYELLFLLIVIFFSAKTIENTASTNNNLQHTEKIIQLSKLKEFFVCKHNKINLMMFFKVENAGV